MARKWRLQPIAQLGKPPAHQSIVHAFMDGRNPRIPAEAAVPILLELVYQSFRDIIGFCFVEGVAGLTAYLGWLEKVP
jgi:hypothetical protein